MASSKFTVVHFRPRFGTVATACGINLGNLQKPESSSSSSKHVRGCDACIKKMKECKQPPVFFDAQKA